MPPRQPIQTDTNLQAEIACLQTGMNSLSEKSDRMLDTLEGNGRPGLTDRMTLVEQRLLEQGQVMEKVSGTQVNLAQSLQDLHNAIQKHLDPDNADHHTMARAIRKDPKGVLFWFALAAAALLLANQIGFLSAVLRLLGIPNV